MPVWQLVLIQVLLTGLVLCVFALFHHVIPRIRLRTEGLPGPIGTVERQTSPTPAPTTEPDLMPDETEPEEPVPTPEPEPETWKERFAEHFADEVQWTEDSYRSPELSVTIAQVSRPDEFPNMT